MGNLSRALDPPSPRGPRDKPPTRIEDSRPCAAGPSAVGLVAAAGPDKILVDFSSMRPELTRAWAAELREQCGMGWIDAPVSGGVPGAEAGTLAIMAGGSQADFARVAPVVAHLASRFTLMGPSGAGQTTKLANQIVSGCTMMVIAECISFAQKAGVDASRLPEALAGGFADSKPMQIFGPRFAAQVYEPKLGAIETLIKDLDTVRDVARDVKTPVPMTAQCLELMRLLAGKGHENEDVTVLTRLYSERPMG